MTVDTGAGAPSLTLSNGAAAVYQPGQGTALTFVYTVAPSVGESGQTVSDLKVTGLALNGAVIADAAGDTVADTSLAGFSTANTGIIVAASISSPQTIPTRHPCSSNR